MTITPGKTVSMEYTLKLESEQVVDSNVGGQPLTFVQGENQILPALETEMDGMNVGESKNIELAPEDGYGQVIKEAIIEVGRDQLPEDARQVGAAVQGQTAQGQALRGKVTQIDDQKAVIDFNHPLAGEKLLFEVKVLDVQ